MKGIILEAFGEPGNLKIKEISVPEIAEGQVLVKVNSTSVNPVDAKTRSGKGIAALLKGQLPVILGWDISGTVTAVADDVTALKIGDEVFAMLAFPKLAKAYSEYVVANASELALKPSNISHDEAAAASLAALTAWQALTTHATVKKGDRVLIHAAAGGVGHFAVQMAKHLGAYVIGTSSAANKEFILSLGADEHIDYKAQPFETVIKDIDLVLDSMGGENVDRSIRVIRKGGTLISFPSAMSKVVAGKGKAAGVNAFHFKVSPNGDDMKEIAALLEKKILHSHVSKVFSFDQIAAAHTQIESGRTVGKIVVNVS
jgi:NADPH:quinone reductase-like Zn-dependent oxidoreductase